MENKKKVITLVVSYVVATLLVLLIYYIALPPINLQSVDFWIFLTFVVLLYLLPVGITRSGKIGMTSNNGKTQVNVGIKFKKILFFVFVPLAFVLIGGMISSTFFNARKYASIITVSDRVFEEDMAETENVTNVALMDSESAEKYGNKVLGELIDVVSQYELSPVYNQINYDKKPKKISNLEYDGFFKWIGNKKNGIPGYVMVDPVEFSAKYVELKVPMKYAESGYFGDDLMRKLRFSYPTKILGTPRFEIDDEGNPVYIVPCMKPRVGVFGAMDVNGAILFNPCSGESKLYDIAEVPMWVDIVYSGNLATEKYNWQGMLSGGWLNSKIGNKGCKQTTDDFGYVVIEDDVWYYTGVTSVTSDKSNIGFILSNARTGEYKFYSVTGAEEHSAMGAAQGEVQEKGYVASFPVLINVSGEATYIMVLKDANKIVKLYALVNVENYSIVATGSTQIEAMKEYKKLLDKEGILDDVVRPDAQTFNITIKKVEEGVVHGNTIFYYEVDEVKDGVTSTVYYKLALSDDESAIFIKAGDKLIVTRSETATSSIYQITSWKKAE